MVKGQAFFGPEALGMGRQIGGQLFLARLHGGHVLDDEFHLLSHAAANDDIVAVQARRSAFAIEHLVANVVLDKALQFLLGRRTLPRAGETVRQGGDALLGDNDLGGRLCFVLLAEETEEAEEDSPKQEELEQRLPEQMQLHGVYQIGDV
jgi:hypothetical protein